MNSQRQATALFLATVERLAEYGFTIQEAVTMSDERLIGTVPGIGYQGLLCIRLYGLSRAYFIRLAQRNGESP